MHVIALDLGGTKLASALLDDAGTVMNKETLTLGERSGPEVGSLISDQLKKLLSEKENVAAVGISVPGIYYPDSGCVWAPNIPGWDNYPLLSEVRTSLSEINRNITVSVDSDRACYIFGEVWKGAAKGCRNAVYLAVGTGIGAGILIEGSVLRGSQDIAGAIGWMALKQPFREGYSQYGCFEYHASGEGIARIVRERILNLNGYSGVLSGKPLEKISAADVFNAYDQNDPVALKVIEECIGLWGMAAANLVSLFNPDVIVFGGGIFGPAGRYLEKIKKEAGKWAQPISMKQVDIKISLLEGEAGLIGAGRLALTGM